MNKFKVGDWVTSLSGETRQVSDFSDNEGSVIIHSDGFMCYASDCQAWHPKEGEWVWYGNEIVEVIDSYNLEYIKITRQNSIIYEEVKYIQLEPFIGKLPSFIDEYTRRK